MTDSGAFPGGIFAVDVELAIVLGIIEDDPAAARTFEADSEELPGVVTSLISLPSGRVPSTRGSAGRGRLVSHDRVEKAAERGRSTSDGRGAVSVCGVTMRDSSTSKRSSLFVSLPPCG